MPFTLTQITSELGGTLQGCDITIVRVAPLDQAQSNEISFLANPKYRKTLDSSKAGAVIVTESVAQTLPESLSLIVTTDPYLYFAKVARLFTPKLQAASDIHASAVIDKSALIPKSCEIGANAVIGTNVSLGERCRILPGCVIENDCTLGNDVVLHANVTLYSNVVLGNDVEIHSGAVIGSDGFGLAWDKTEWFKIPQTGRVVLEDGVEVGANTTIDRGALADTIIRTGAKIDNLVQIAHNVEIGEHTVIAGCTGIAGSSKIGAYCSIGGAAMFVGHIEVADKTYIGGGTLVSKSLNTPNHYASSYPISTHKDWVRNAVHLRHLNDMVKRLATLEKQLQKLQKKD